MGRSALPPFRMDFYSRPCGRGDGARKGCGNVCFYFYSRPCGRGDKIYRLPMRHRIISTHAPAGGATKYTGSRCVTASFLLTPLREGRLGRRCGSGGDVGFLLTPLREGRRAKPCKSGQRKHFYSRPCGRGDPHRQPCPNQKRDFYSRPCGRGDSILFKNIFEKCLFLLTPLREGRQQFSTSPS